MANASAPTAEARQRYSGQGKAGVSVSGGRVPR
jgi:hypothetical protein